MPATTFKRWVRRAGRAPSVHFAVIGALCFFGSSWLAGPEVAERPPIRVPAARVAEAEAIFAAENGRPPGAAEKTAIAERLADEEALFQYALFLGLQDAEVPRLRLASIAAFVEPPGSAAPTSETLAKRAVELGLHHGDYVTRRVLVDAAARLIRAAARLVEPSDEELSRYLEDHGEPFRSAATLRISHLLLSSSRRPHPEAAAAALLARLRREDTSPEVAPALADPGPVPPHLPLLTERALERRFGPDFAAGLAELPEGVWSGPVVSRHGAHLVFVHERRPGRIPELAEARGQVLARWREAAAERWLAERVRQLRAEYEVGLESGAAS